MPSASTNGPPYTITGLTPGTEYRVRVSATNDGGTSAPSAYVNATTTNVPNPIPTENALTGAPSSEWTISGAGDTSVAGFARPFSANVGASVAFAVTGSATVIDVYRIGWYGGDGWRKVATIANTPTTQPTPVTVANSASGTTCSNWTGTATWSTTGTQSGLHVAVIRNGSNAFWAPFVVRDDSRPADVIIKTSDSTWGLAYNHYGSPSSPLSGRSHYGSGGVFNIGQRTYVASYEKPIITRLNLPQTYWLNAEAPMIRWAERNGLNVKYVSQRDIDTTPGVLTGAKVFISSGHDEYWSEPARRTIEGFRDGGGHCLFMSANEVFWRTRVEGELRWCYKDTMQDATDPVSWTGTWKDTRWLDREPENLLTGTDFRMNGIRDETAVVNAATYGTSPFWRGTTVASGTNLTLPRTVGFEADNALPTQPNAALLAATNINIDGSYADDNGQTYNNNGTLTWGIQAQRYASGALVVGFGTCQWSWALDGTHDRTDTTPSVAAQQAMTNLLTDLGAPPATPQSGTSVPTPVALTTYA